jgi:Holliday junction resolvase RusA-like endonuclease
MKASLTFFVHAEPKAQPRGRRSMNGGIYNPPTADAWKDAVRIAANQKAPDRPHTGPIRVDLAFYLPRPKRLKGNESVPHTVKPDKDNLEKAVLDSMKGAFWKDDCQVYGGSTWKYYAPDEQSVGAMITIEWEE